MPIYEYECGGCGGRCSALLPRYDSPDPACPHCGATGLRRLVSSFATTRSESGGGGDFGGGDFGGGDFEGGEFGGDFGGDDFRGGGLDDDF